MGAAALVGAVAPDLIGVPAAALVGAIAVVLDLGAAALVGAIAVVLDLGAAALVGAVAVVLTLGAAGGVGAVAADLDLHHHHICLLQSLLWPRAPPWHHPPAAHVGSECQTLQ